MEQLLVAFAKEGKRVGLFSQPWGSRPRTGDSTVDLANSRLRPDGEAAFKLVCVHSVPSAPGLEIARRHAFRHWLLIRFEQTTLIASFLERPPRTQ